MAITDSGYMNTSTFIKYLEYFKKHTSPTEENLVLLILDNHVSNTSLQAVTFAKDNFIHLLSLPPLSNHKTQPLDRAFFKPLKAYYESVADSWISSHPGPIYHVAGLFSTSFAKTATIDIAREGSRSTGIYPLDKNIFSDVDFMLTVLLALFLDWSRANENYFDRWKLPCTCEKWKYGTK
ncbi:uncharacterized protein [Diabrotica undecimpunctata]|uniref:uncharacterized protein n=1 Tax=Diabrotica undecimpunctata TaxID=50387 RepID=UPI003B6325F4